MLIRAITLGCAIVIALACNRTGNEPVPAVQAKAGVFFGGQLQERTRWPLLLDSVRQSQGFRIWFREPLSLQAHVTWELTRPRLDHKRRVVTTKSAFEANLPAGTEQNDQLITFDESDRPGKWQLDIALDNAHLYGTILDVVPYVPSAADD